MEILEVWQLLSIGIFFSAISISAGIGSAVFYVPFFIFVLNIPVQIAIALGIFVEMAGFAAGYTSYAFRHEIRYRVAIRTVYVAAPFIILGVYLSKIIDPNIVILIFAIALLYFAGQLLIHKVKTAKRVKPMDRKGRALTSLGGLFLGMISAGLGETNEMNYFVRMKYPPAIAAATSVFVVAISALIATIAHLLYMAHTSSLYEEIFPYKDLLIRMAPGAIIGAYIGTVIVNHTKRKYYRRFISIVLLGVAILSIIFVLKGTVV